MRRYPRCIKWRFGAHIADNYERAVKQAAADTHLPKSSFPADNPFTIGQILDRDYEP